MKKVLIILFFAFFLGVSVGVASAQNGSSDKVSGSSATSPSTERVESFVKKWGSVAGTEFVEISSSLLSSLSKGPNTDSLIRYISSIQILSAKKSISGFNNALTILTGSGFGKLMNVKKLNVAAVVWLANDKKSLLTITYTSNEITVMILYGDINSYVINAVLNGKIKLR